jgi:hypothetical protein
LRAVDDRFRRAHQQFESIKKTLRRYYASDAHDIRGKIEIKGEWTFHPMYVAAPPERFHTRLGEMLHNLRSSLDHLAWVLVETSAGSPGKDTKWPVCDTRPTADAYGIHPPPHVAGCDHPDVLAFIDEHQPYAYGADFFEHGLWVLHRLAILDRHRHIVSRGASVMPITIHYSGIPRDWEFEFTARRKSVTEFGAVLDLGPDIPDPSVDAEGTLRIVIHDPGPDGLDNPKPVGLTELLMNAYDETSVTIEDAAERFFS